MELGVAGTDVEVERIAVGKVVEVAGNAAAAVGAAIEVIVRLDTRVGDGSVWTVVASAKFGPTVGVPFAERASVKVPLARPMSTISNASEMTIAAPRSLVALNSRLATRNLLS